MAAGYVIVSIGRVDDVTGYVRAIPSEHAPSLGWATDRLAEWKRRGLSTPRQTQSIHLAAKPF